MEFIHHSRWPLTFNRDHVYTPDIPHGYGKPVGLWISPHGEDDWAQWCLSESHLAPWRYRVTLDLFAQILWIDDAEGLIDFHTTYCTETDFSRLMEKDPILSENGFAYRQRPIDWGKVAADYDGLIIAPYLWSQRLFGPHWYGGWDCASGCIWTASAVLAVEPAPLLALKSGNGSETAIGSP